MTTGGQVMSARPAGKQPKPNSRGRSINTAALGAAAALGVRFPSGTLRGGPWPAAKQHERIIAKQPEHVRQLFAVARFDDAVRFIATGEAVIAIKADVSSLSLVGLSRAMRNR